MNPDDIVYSPITRREFRKAADLKLGDHVRLRGFRLVYVIENINPFTSIVPGSRTLLVFDCRSTCGAVLAGFSAQPEDMIEMTT